MKIGIRPVTYHDWKFILEIRNDPEVRKACHDTSVITFERHRAYMEKLQRDNDSYQWIITCDGKDAGHVKIISGELGYMLKGEYRGKGIGAEFHDLVFAEARKIGITKLKDTIKVHNEASLKLALRTGFRQKRLQYRAGEPYAYVLEKEI